MSSDDASAGGFVLTDDMIDMVANASAAAAVISMSLGIALLVTAAWVYSFPAARPSLDRVSFRLVLWSMLFEVIYSASYIPVSLSSAMLSDIGCEVGMYFTFASLTVVNNLCTCIALNLMLTICFGLNPVELRLERWYVGVSIALGILIQMIPVLRGHFGPDPVLEVCWLTPMDPEERFRVFLLDLYLWQMIVSLIATLAVLVTLYTLFRQSRATSRALFGGDAINRRFAQDARSIDNCNPEETSESSRDLQSVIEGGSIERPIRHRGILETLTNGKFGKPKKKRRKGLGTLEDRFMKIAIKVSAYPVALVICNSIIAAGDLSLTGGVKSVPAYGLYCLYYTLYGCRGLVFVFLGMFVDPCLRRGIKVAWRSRRNARSLRTIGDAEESNSQTNQSNPQDSNVHGLMSIFDLISSSNPSSALDPITSIPNTEKDIQGISTPSKSNENSSGIFDFAQALANLPYEATLELHPPSTPTYHTSFFGRRTSLAPTSMQYPANSLGIGLPENASTPVIRRLSDCEETRRVSENSTKFTRSFTGVRSGTLPDGLTDDVDVDLRVGWNEHGGSAGVGTDFESGPSTQANSRKDKRTVRVLSASSVLTEQRLNNSVNGSSTVSPLESVIPVPATQETISNPVAGGSGGTSQHESERRKKRLEREARIKRIRKEHDDSERKFLAFTMLM